MESCPGVKCIKMKIKSGFLIGSMRSWGGVSGPSQKWLKLCVVSRLDPNGPKMTLFQDFFTNKSDLEPILAQNWGKS